MVPKRLDCGETWSSNRTASSAVILPGLDAWVQAVPSEHADAGGDIHYLSACPRCEVCRVALADVSGHGDQVAASGENLRQLMLQYLSALQQLGLMRDLNRAARSALGSVAQRGLLVVTNAATRRRCGTRPRGGVEQAGNRSRAREEQDCRHAAGFAGRR